MSEGEDRTEPGRARRHARPPSQDAPAQNGWPSRYGPRPDFTVPPDSVSAVPGEEQPPARAGRHGRQPGPGTPPGPGGQPVPGWGADPYQDSGLDAGHAPYPPADSRQGAGSYPPADPRPADPGPADPRPDSSQAGAAPYRGTRRRPERSDGPERPGPQSPPAPAFQPAPRRTQGPSAPQTPPAPQTTGAPQAPPFRPARRPSQGPPGQQVPQDPQAPSVWAPSAGRPRPGFVPNGDRYQPPGPGGDGRGIRNGNGAHDDTVAYDRPAGWSGRRGPDRGPDPDDYIDPYGDRDGYGSRRDPYADQDGYAQRPDPYADRDSYADRGDARAERDSYGGRRRAESPAASAAPAGDYDFPETDDYAQHVAGPGHAAARAGQAPAGRTRRRDRHQQPQEPVPEAAAAPPWDDEDGYEEDDRFVPGLGGSRDEDDYDDDNDDQTGRGGRGGRTSGRGGRGAGGGKRRRRWLVPLVIILIILLLPLGAGGWYAYKFVQGRYYPADYAGAGTGQAVVQVQTGQTATAVGQRLVKLGVVASLRAFELAAEHSTSNHSLEPGTYRMKRQMKASLAYTLLVNQTTRIQDKITIPEGLRVSQIVAQLGAHSGIPLADYQAALKQPGTLGLPSYAGGKVEGYLFPATYEVQPNQTASDVLKGMVDRYNQEATSDNLTQQAAAVKLSPGKVMIVASLIQAEGGSTTYYKQIARVIYNRLSKGMKLQLDSTVMYGLNTYGIIASNAQLQSTSPYNTYKYTGLPPGPIDNPGHAAIEAALHPGSGNNLYFVTTNPKTGLTKFTSSESQFEQFRQELEHNLGK